MKKSALLITFALLVVSAFSQKQIDVIYLTDGSIYKGQILNDSTKNIKLETLSQNILAFDSNEVLKTGKENYSDPRAIKTSGYMNFTSFGVLMGSTANEIQAPLSILMEHNYRYNTYLAFGAVTGLELLNEATVPLAFNTKGFLPLRGGSTLFIGGSIGYSFSVEELKDVNYVITDHYGGQMANAEIGLLFPSYGNLGIFIAAGYRYNELSYTREDWWLESVDRTIYYNRISLRVGVSFY